MALFTFPISHMYRFNLFFSSYQIKVNFAWSRNKKKIYIDIQLLYLFTKKNLLGLYIFAVFFWFWFTFCEFIKATTSKSRIICITDCIADWWKVGKGEKQTLWFSKAGKTFRKSTFKYYSRKLVFEIIIEEKV